MARRLKSDPRATAQAIALIALAFLGPIVILVLWVMAEDRAKKMNGQVIDQQQLTGEMVASQARLDELWDWGSRNGIAQRQDGLFDERTTSGRNLNRSIEGETANLQALQAAKDAQIMPLVHRDTMRGAAAAWVVVFVYNWSKNPSYQFFGASILGCFGALVAGAVTYFVRKGVYAQRAEAIGDPNLLG